MAPSLRCPRCATVVPVVAGVDPVCPSCGFNGKAPASAVAAAPAAVPAAAMVPPALSAPPLGTPAGLAPVPAGAGPVARGKILHPGLVVLFHIITLGIYFFVFWWRTSREADEAGAGTRSHGPAKAGILMMVIGVVLLVFVIIAAVFTFIGTALANEDDPTYSEEQFVEDLIAAGIAYIAAAVLLLLVVFAGRITLLVGQYRLWKGTRALEEQAGLAKPIGAGLMLGLSIVAMLLGGGNNANSAAEMAVSGALGLISLALYLTVAALTQSHLNRVWQAPAPTAGAPPAGWTP